MKVLLVRSEGGINDKGFDSFCVRLKEKNISVCVWQEKRCITNKEVNELGIDLIITFDLCGFNHSTLTDGIAYNLLDCKQIHFLEKRNFPNERCLSKPLSISMFFFCADAAYYEYLVKTYSDIPFLKVINDLTEDNDEDQYADVLCAIMEKVTDICGMIIG